jgi:hypothetical protein
MRKLPCADKQPDSAASYHINHSTDLYLIAEKGEVAHRLQLLRRRAR